ncbi:MAG: type II secretion system protein GspN [Deltaproteobacteria bacterium]|nr:type II secretion system protein GspN [Deltaproteobacteria bacterium]
MINLSSSQMRIVKAIGYPLFFFGCYFLFLTLTFPADRFLPVAEAKLTEVLGRKVKIDELSISPLGSVSLSGVTIEVPQVENVGKKDTHEEDAEDAEGEDDENDDDTPEATSGAAKDTSAEGSAKPAPPSIVPKYYIEKMNVDVSLWSFIFGDLELEIAADFLGGNILVKYKGPLSSGSEEEDSAVEAAEIAKLTPSERMKRARENSERQPQPSNDKAKKAGDSRSFSFVATGLNLIQFWDLKDLLPLPMFGTLDFGIELSTSTGKMKNAEGKIWVDGRNISLGKGQSKVEVIEGMGPMTVDAFGIQALQLEMNVKEGKCSFGRVKLVSNDLAATAEGDIQFSDPMSTSVLNLYFTFKLLDGYAQRSPNAKTLVSLMPGALAAAHRTDGFFGYSYRGTFKTAVFRPQKFFGTADRGRRTPAIRNTRSVPNRPVAVPRTPTPAPPTPVLPPTMPEPEPVPEPESEPEIEPEIIPEAIPAPHRPPVSIKDMSDRLDARQAESERKRMEAMIRAESASKAAQMDEEEAQGEEIENPGDGNDEGNSPGGEEGGAVNEEGGPSGEEGEEGEDVEVVEDVEEE